MFKRILLTAAVAVGLMGMNCQASIFDAKVYKTGKPLEKPMVLHEFRELAGAHPVEDMTFTDLEGKKHKLSDFRKHVVFIDMWATWCEPCERELGALAALQERYNKPGSRVRFLAVSVDKKKKNLKKYLASKGYPNYDTWRDEEAGELQKIMPPDIMPSMTVFDGAGNLIGFVRGYVSWDDPSIHAYIEKLIEKYADK